MGEKPECKLSGGISRIGLVNTEFNYKEMQGQLSSQKVRGSDFKEASISMIDWLEKQGSFDKVRCIGHRIVQGMKHSHAEVIDRGCWGFLKSVPTCRTSTIWRDPMKGPPKQ
jgi:acetate kinase